MNKNQQDSKELVSAEGNINLKEWVEPVLEIYPAYETAFGLPGPGDGGGAYS